MMRNRTARSMTSMTAVVLIALTSCGADADPESASVPETSADSAPTAVASELSGTLRVGAIPDQDPEKLGRLYGLLVDEMEAELDVEVEYVPVVDYAAAVNLFRVGDLDLVWFGGLTGVQARLQTPGAMVIAQRDIDEDFRSVFIANSDAGLEAFDDVGGLSALAGRRLTFGSETSTSGRLMPQYFLDQAGVGPADFDGEPGFSGSHDKTVDLVASGTYEVGVLNEQVWRKRLTDGSVDPQTVIELFVTPGYHDYHWLLNPTVPARLGESANSRITDFFTSLSLADPEDAQILELFGAGAFVASMPSNYAEIEATGRKLGLVTE
jgi:phosphonate transport system substrate-binding protein